MAALFRIDVSINEKLTCKIFYLWSNRFDNAVAVITALDKFSLLLLKTNCVGALSPRRTLSLRR